MANDPVGYDGLAAPVKRTGKVDYPDEPGRIYAEPNETGWSTFRIWLSGIGLFVVLIAYVVFVHWVSSR